MLCLGRHEQEITAYRTSYDKHGPNGDSHDEAQGELLFRRLLLDSLFFLIFLHENLLSLFLQNLLCGG